MSYSQTLAATVACEGATGIFGQAENTGRLDAIRLANGAVIPWCAPDDDGVRETHFGASLVRALTVPTMVIAKIDADTDHTDAWKVKERAKAAEEASQRFNAARADVDRAIAEFDAGDARESVATPLEPGNHADALVDHECRQWLRTLSNDELVELGKHLGEPQHRRTLVALMRSPIPLPHLIAETARNAWIEHQMHADPQGFRMRRQAQERVAWLRTMLDHVGGVVAAMQPRSSAPIIRQVA